MQHPSQAETVPLVCVARAKCKEKFCSPVYPSRQASSLNALPSGRTLMANAGSATLLGLGAALMAGVSFVILQRSAQQVTDDVVGHFALFHLSLRNVQWWLGSLAAIGSFVFQALALTMGSVVLVQSLQATALLFALPIDARLTHHRLTGREWMWAVLLAAAVAVIVLAGDPGAGYARAPLHTWVVVAMVTVPAVLLCVIGARFLSGTVSAV